ncbi:hypothetical protein SLA2020_319520 [Shorea laevis]
MPEGQFRSNVWDSGRKFSNMDTDPDSVENHDFQVKERAKSLEELRARTAQFTDEQNEFQNPAKLSRRERARPFLIMDK